MNQFISKTHRGARRNFLPGTRCLWALAAFAGAVGFLSGCAGVKDTSRTFSTVVIDAGHGGHDSGARSRRGTSEKYVALDVARRLDARLREAGFRTVMTRGDDRFIPLDQRAAISNRQANAIFVSVHFNHSRSRAARGTESYYYSPVASGIAQRIEDNLDDLPGVSSRGVKQARFRVLRKAQYPAVLVECGFLSNRSEANRCASPSYRDAVAERIAEALIVQRFGNGARAASKIATVRGQNRASGG